MACLPFDNFPTRGKELQRLVPTYRNVTAGLPFDISKSHIHILFSIFNAQGSEKVHHPQKKSSYGVASNFLQFQIKFLDLVRIC